MVTASAIALLLVAGCGSSSGGEEVILAEPTAQDAGGSGSGSGSGGDGAPDDDGGTPDDGAGGEPGGSPDDGGDDDGNVPTDDGGEVPPDDEDPGTDPDPVVVVVAAGEDVQVAANGLEPGDTLRLGAGVHRIATPIPGEGLAGLRIGTSGTAEAPIRIEGAPDGTSVIDQGRDGTRGDTPVAGLVLDCASHVIVRDLTIRNVDLAGVSTALSGCPSRDLTLERLHVHDVHGKNLVAALRIANARDVTIRDNRLRRVFDGGNEAAAPLPGTGTTGTIVVERNAFEAVGAGVAVAVRGAAGIADLAVRKNVFTDSGIGFLARSGAAGGTVRDVALEGNLFERVDGAVELALGEVVSPSSAFSFRWNTVAGTTDAVWLQAGVTGVTFVENVFSDLASDVLVTLGAGSTVPEDVFDRLDGNVYDDTSPVLAWTLDLGGDDEVRYVGFDAWRGAGADAPGLAASPDTEGSAGALRFVAPESGDYSLVPGSTGSASAADGGDPGAFRDDAPPGPAPG